MKRISNGDFGPGMWKMRNGCRAHIVLIDNSGDLVGLAYKENGNFNCGQTSDGEWQVQRYWRGDGVHKGLGGTDGLDLISVWNKYQ